MCNPLQVSITHVACTDRLLARSWNAWYVCLSYYVHLAKKVDTWKFRVSDSLYFHYGRFPRLGADWVPLGRLGSGQWKNRAVSMNSLPNDNKPTCIHILTHIHVIWMHTEFTNTLCKWCSSPTSSMHATTCNCLLWRRQSRNFWCWFFLNTVCLSVMHVRLACHHRQEQSCCRLPHTQDSDKMIIPKPKPTLMHHSGFIMQVSERNQSLHMHVYVVVLLFRTKKGCCCVARPLLSVAAEVMLHVWVCFCMGPSCWDECTCVGSKSVESCTSLERLSPCWMLCRCRCGEWTPYWLLLLSRLGGANWVSRAGMSCASLREHSLLETDHVHHAWSKQD